MPIATKTAVALLAIFVSLLVGVWIILAGAVSPGFSQLEAMSHERDKARVEAQLETTRSDLRSRAQDYASWDDTYTFATGGYPAYIADNFGAEDWFDSYDVDLAIIADEHGKLLWSGMRNDAHAGENIIAHILGDAHGAGSNAVGVYWDAHGPLLYTAAPVLRSDGGGPVEGVVIFARAISATTLAEQAQVDVRLVNAARPPAALLAQFAPLRQAPSQTWTTGESLNSLIALRSAEGKLVGAVYATRARDITALGARLIGVSLLLFAAMSALAIAALWFLLKKLVIARVVDLQTHLDAQSAAADVALYVDAPSRDELGRLTAAYNALVLRLRQSNELAVRAEFERESADKANDMKSAFLANISHELRTPLNAVIGYAELLDEELADLGVPSARSDLEKIRGAGKHLLSLVNEILDLSKIEAGKLDIRPSSFRIDEMLRQVSDTVAPLAHANDSSFVIETSQDLGAVYSDEMRLRQCLINVSANACKFTQNGAVVLRAERRSEHGQAMLRFEVEDTGIGMTPEQLERVFEPFAQADPLIQRTFGGTGLGLALTRKLLGLLGGRIDADSVKGEGSLFVLTVPVIALDAELPAEAA